jgi:hypothetical protein
MAHGFVDALRNDVVVGWTRDLTHPGRRLEVGVYQGEQLIGSAVADLPRKDLITARIGDGRHGFQVKLAIELLKDPDEPLKVYALTSRGRVLLERGVIAPPKSAIAKQVELSTVGFLEKIEGTMLLGWAYNPDQPNSPALVDVYDDERYLGTATADKDRSTSSELGLSGKARGFSFDLRQLDSTVLRERLRARVSGTTFELAKPARFAGTGGVEAVAAVPVAPRVEAPERNVSGPEEGEEDLVSVDGDDTTDVAREQQVGLVLIGEDGQAEDVVATVRAWAQQSAAGTSVAVIWRGAREDVVDNLQDDVTRSVVWLDGDFGHELQVFLKACEFVVFAQAGEIFDSGLAALLPRLNGLPDVVVWNGSADARYFARSGEALRLETFLQRPPVGGFVARANAVARYPGSLAQDLRTGHLHAVRLWLALQAELRWCAIETPVRGNTNGGMSAGDAGGYGKLVAGERWAAREPSGAGPMLVPVRQPKQVSIAIWRGCDRDDLPALRTILNSDFAGTLQLLIPTGGSNRKGQERLTHLRQLCEGVRSTTQKLVDCPDNPAACCAALLAAADGEVVVMLDGQVALPSSSLAELVSWPLADGVGAVTLALRDASDLMLANAGNIAGGGEVLEPALGDQSRIVDVTSSALIAVEKRKAVAAGGIDVVRYPDAWFAPEFCLRLRLCGYQTIRLTHLSAQVPDGGSGLALPAELPLQTRILFRTAQLLEPGP